MAAEVDVPRPEIHGAPPTEWLQREDRLDDWIDELEGLDAMIATAASDAEAGISEAGAERPPEIEVRQVTDQRDTLARRIEMERNTLRHALGHDDKAAEPQLSLRRVGLPREPVSARLVSPL